MWFVETSFTLPKTHSHALVPLPMWDVYSVRHEQALLYSGLVFLLYFIMLWQRNCGCGRGRRSGGGGSGCGCRRRCEWVVPHVCRWRIVLQRSEFTGTPSQTGWPKVRF